MNKVYKLDFINYTLLDMAKKTEKNVLTNWDLTGVLLN